MAEESLEIFLLYLCPSLVEGQTVVLLLVDLKVHIIKLLYQKVQDMFASIVLQNVCSHYRRKEEKFKKVKKKTCLKIIIMNLCGSALKMHIWFL